MKKIFFVAIAATLLAAGCQKTEVINQVNPVDGTSMTFAPNLGKLTKAATAEGTGEANLSEQDFRLWAYYKADDPSRGEAAKANSVYDKMSNIIISDASGDWKATTTHFWPGKDKVLKFFAISADQATYGTGEGIEATGSKVSINDDRTQMTVKDFTVDPAKPDTDLMVADYVEAAQNGSANSTSNTVNFTFRHALTKVQFLFRNTETNMPVYVQQMYVEGINTVADLTVNGAVGNTTMTWGTPKTSAIFAGDYAPAEGTTLVELNATEAENISAWNSAVTLDPDNYMELTGTYQPFTTWLVIPQDVFVADTKDLKVTIAYVIKSATETRQFISTFSLGSATVVPTWGKNQYVKYNINLTPNIIGFDATVEDWTPVHKIEDSETGDNGVNDPTNDGQDVVIN